MPEKLHSVRYVADVLDLHPKTLYRKLRGNEIDLDFIRPTGSRHIAIRQADLEEFLAKHCVKRDGSGKAA